MFCNLEQERTKFIERKKEKIKAKKEKKIVVVKIGVVKIKGYLKMYNLVKYFMLYLRRFCVRPVLTPNFWDGFRALKRKPRAADHQNSKFQDRN